MTIEDFQKIEALVINLDTRPDRWQQVVSEIPKIGITNFKRFSAIQGANKVRDREIAFTESYLRCIRQNTGPVIIFEDDACFYENALENLTLSLLELPLDFDLLYLGANVVLPAIPYSEHLCRVETGVYTTHVILYSEQGRKFVAEHYTDDPKDGLVYDAWLFQTGLRQMKSYVCKPIIAYQRASFSDIQLHHTDYISNIENNNRNNLR